MTKIKRNLFAVLFLKCLSTSPEKKIEHKNRKQPRGVSVANLMTISALKKKPSFKFPGRLGTFACLNEKYLLKNFRLCVSLNIIYLKNFHKISE